VASRARAKEDNAVSSYTLLVKYRSLSSPLNNNNTDESPRSRVRAILSRLTDRCALVSSKPSLDAAHVESYMLFLCCKHSSANLDLRAAANNSHKQIADCS